MLNINFPQVYSLEDKQKGTHSRIFMLCVHFELPYSTCWYIQVLAKIMQN
jgi:hypothetical protein